MCHKQRPNDFCSSPRISRPIYCTALPVHHEQILRRVPLFLLTQPATTSRKPRKLRANIVGKKISWMRNRDQTSFLDVFKAGGTPLTLPTNLLAASDGQCYWAIQLIGSDWISRYVVSDSIFNRFFKRRYKHRIQ